MLLLSVDCRAFLKISPSLSCLWSYTMVSEPYSRSHWRLCLSICGSFPSSHSPLIPFLFESFHRYCNCDGTFLFRESIGRCSITCSPFAVIEAVGACWLIAVGGQMGGSDFSLGMQWCAASRLPNVSTPVWSWAEGEFGGLIPVGLSVSGCSGLGSPSRDWTASLRIPKGTRRNTRHIRPPVPPSGGFAPKATSSLSGPIRKQAERCSRQTESAKYDLTLLLCCWGVSRPHTSSLLCGKLIHGFQCLEMPEHVELLLKEWCKVF